MAETAKSMKNNNSKIELFFVITIYFLIIAIIGVVKANDTVICQTKADYPASILSQTKVVEALRYIDAQEYGALNGLIDQGHVLLTSGGISVYIVEKSTVYRGLIRACTLDTKACAWMPETAVNCGGK